MYPCTYYIHSRSPQQLTHLTCGEVAVCLSKDYAYGNIMPIEAVRMPIEAVANRSNTPIEAV